MRIRLIPNSVPVPLETVAGEGCRVVRKADVDVASLPHSVINAMRDDHSIGPTREVVIIRDKGLTAPHAARAIKLSEEFLGLRIDGKHRVSSHLILVDELCNVVKLHVSVG